MSARVANELIEWLRSYVSTRVDLRLQDERRCIAPHVVLDFGRQGILGGQRVPRTYGGLGLALEDALRIGEQLGAIDLTLAAWVGQNSWLGIQPIVDAGSPAQKEDLLPDLAQGRTLASFALTELAAGSDPNAIAATLRSTSGGFRLHGDKSWIGNAGWASVLVVFARQLDSEER